MLTYILVAHVPVWPLSIGDHLPHDDAVAPYVTGGGELPEGNGLWCRPPDGNLTTLQTHTHTQEGWHRHSGRYSSLLSADTSSSIQMQKKCECKFHRWSRAPA